MKKKCAVKRQSIIVFVEVYRFTMKGFQMARLRMVNKNKEPLLSQGGVRIEGLERLENYLRHPAYIIGIRIK
jgi:hypothetical protein